MTFQELYNDNAKLHRRITEELIPMLKENGVDPIYAAAKRGGNASRKEYPSLATILQWAAFELMSKVKEVNLKIISNHEQMTAAILESLESGGAESAKYCHTKAEELFKEDELLILLIWWGVIELTKRIIEREKQCH